MPSMTASDLSSRSLSDVPRGRSLPTCSICAEGMVAPEASAITADGSINYLWTCETCGYGFVTKYRAPVVCH